MTWSKAQATCVTPGVESSSHRLRSRPTVAPTSRPVGVLPRRRAEVAAEELVGAVDEVDLHRALTAPNLRTARACALAASVSRSFGAARSSRAQPRSVADARATCVDGPVERLPIGGGRVRGAADLPHVLERGRPDLLIGRGRLEVVQGLDVPAHVDHLVSGLRRDRRRRADAEDDARGAVPRITGVRRLGADRSRSAPQRPRREAPQGRRRARWSRRRRPTPARRRRRSRRR